MSAPDILASSGFGRLAEWSTRLKGFPPATGPPAGSMGHRVDHYVRPLRNRWIYPLVHRTSEGGSFEVPFEAYVDEFGDVWIADDSRPPAHPIEDREDPRETGTADSHAGFRMTDEDGRALSVRLLLSPFRLSSAAIGLLRRQDVVEEIISTIPPLWTWKNGDDPDSPVHSADGYSLKVEPLWMRVEGESDPAMVWVGSDPFAIAERRSNLFVKRRRAYARVFEPWEEDAKQHLSNMTLAQAIYDAVVIPDEARDRYGRVVDIGKLNAALSEFDETRTKMRREFEKSARALCDHLDSPLFALLQYSSLEDEGFVSGADRHEPLAEHYRVLDKVSRQLANCEAGLELMAKWAKDADDNAFHFANKMVLPTSQLPVHIFKTVRWSSKSAVGVLRKFIPWLVARDEGGLRRRLADAFVHLGVVESLDEVDSAVQSMRHRIGDVMAGLNIKHASELVEFKGFGQKLVPKIAVWFEGGQEGVGKMLKEFRNPTFWGFAILDVANVCLASKAILDARGPEAILKAVAGAGAAIGFLATSLARPVVDNLADKAKSRGLRILYAAQAVCGIVYATLDFISASEAFAKDDNDRAVALLVAGAAELIAAGTYIAMLANPLAAAPAYLVVVGVIAAAAYTAAALLTDDPLELFLGNCEWGSTPYGAPGYHPIWATLPVAQWKNNYVVQSEIMLRVLSRFTIGWDLASWPAVEVSSNLRRDGTRIEASFRGIMANGRVLEEKAQVFEGASLPNAVPVKLELAPRRPYQDVPGIRRIWLVVRYRARSGATEEVMDVLLMDDGQGVTSGYKSTVD